jgi:hypothetical protein
MDIITLLAGPLGGVLGLFGALAQKWVGMKEARANHEMKLAEIEVLSRVDLQKADISLRNTTEQQAGEAFKAAIDSQTALRPTSSWATNALALFRPGLTAYLLLSSTGLAIIFREAKPEMLEFIITSMFSMSSVAMGYWFGVRTSEKMAVTAAFPARK